MGEPQVVWLKAEVLGRPSCVIILPFIDTGLRNSRHPHSETFVCGLNRRQSAGSARTGSHVDGTLGESWSSGNNWLHDVEPSRRQQVVL